METPSPPPSPSTGPERRGSWRSALVVAAVTWLAYQGWTAWRQERLADAVQDSARAGDIIMYTTTDCPYCAAAREWLDARRVPWRECNIDTDQACLAAFRNKGAPGVPLLNARGQWRLGFDPQWLSKVLQPAP